MRLGTLGTLGTMAGALGALLLAVTPAEASSHREAPFVTKNPKVDGTDFYAFESYEAGHTGMVTFLANYQPLQDAYAGPNYFGLDTNALYEIMVDNNGDGVEDFTFQFQFQTALSNAGKGFSLLIGPDGGGLKIAVPFYNVGLIPDPDGGADSPNLNVIETYSVGFVVGPRRGSLPTPVITSSGSAVFDKPADNVGVSSFGSAGGYATYAQQFVYSGVTVPGCLAADKGTAQVFVGQRAESFAVNLGPTFDLVDIPAAVVTNGGKSAGYAKWPNPLAKKNVTTIALEVPRDCIWQSSAQPVIGAWTTASVRQARVVNPAASYAEPSVEGGAWTQVSRLGNPLVNEVVIGLPDKDLFNGSAPAGDAQFADYVTHPTLPAIIDLIFGTDLQPTVFPRTDLVAAFLTGIPGLNTFPSVDGGAPPVAAEYLHLNTNTEALVDAQQHTGSAVPTPYATSGKQTQNRLGAADCITQGVVGETALTASSCDPYGYPNGRRPIDDVVDLALDVVEGYLLPSGAPAYTGTNPSGWTFFTDGVDQSETPFAATFPYLTTPTQGANGDGT